MNSEERHKDILDCILRSTLFQKETTNSEDLKEFMHMKNKSGDTLLAMVALQGPELEEQKL